MDGVLLCKKAVSMDGWIVVKENMCTDREAEVVYDVSPCGFGPTFWDFGCVRHARALQLWVNIINNFNSKTLKCMIVNKFKSIISIFSFDYMMWNGCRRRK